MPKSTTKPEKPKKLRGPKRVEYIPARLRGITGVEQLTTVRQMTRLLEYLQAGPENRLPFVRLGASVQSKSRSGKPKATSTYAVDVDGQISVIRLNSDPRRSHVWVQCERRPWNLCRDRRLQEGARHGVEVSG